MCGISGLFGEGNFINVPRLKCMTQFMNHRGPDEEAFFVSPPLAMGSVRLSIVDAEENHQPLKNEEQNVCSIFNGEIYNYRELREELLQKGHRLTQTGDGEVIPHLYEEFGLSFLSKLRGTFAIALWDEHLSQLILIRDRLGVKPLYYRLTREGLAFASELRALLIGEVKPVINIQALDQYLSYRYAPAPFTIFEGIYKLSPGSILLVSLEDHEVQVKTQNYWHLPESKEEISYDEAVERVRETLKESMIIRWPSEIPAAYFFSGGLDSSGLVAMHQAHFKEPARTYSIGFEKPRATHNFRYYSELEQARQAAKCLRTNHFERIISFEQVTKNLPQILSGMDEPIADPTAIPLYFLSQFAASQGEKVVLSGEGADELFGGYTTYLEPSNYRRFNELPQLARIIAKRLFSQKVKRFSMPLKERYLGVGGLLRIDQKQRIYSLNMIHLLRERQSIYRERSYLENEQFSEEDCMLQFDLCSWLPEDALMKSDKMTMRHSLEMRLPYLDSQLVELVYKLPFSYKVEKKINKRILRSALDPYLPKQMINRPKNGFPVPITAWLIHELSDEIRSVLLDSGSSIQKFILPNEIEKMLETDISHRSARLIWALYTLEVYLRLAVPEVENKFQFVLNSTTSDQIN